MFKNYHWTVVEAENACTGFKLAKQSDNTFENFNRYYIVNPNTQILFEEIEYLIESTKDTRSPSRSRSCCCFVLQGNKYFFYVKKSSLVKADKLFIQNIGRILHGGGDLTEDDLNKLASSLQRLKASLKSTPKKADGR